MSRAILPHRPLGRGALAALITLASLTVPGAARAQDLSAYTPGRIRSPQHFAFELKFGLYSPDIDATPGLRGKPFSELFQDDPAKKGQRPDGALLTTLELDWQIWHGFGSLGLGASVGLSRRSAKSFEYSDVNLPCTANVDCVRSSDETTLTVIPFALEAIYRFDVLAERWNIPIVPYLKGGVAYFFWFIQNGAGDLATTYGRDRIPGYSADDTAIGGTFGLVAHPGVALQLDIIDPGAARTLDTELGINHTYLFFELNYAWVTGFGSSTKLVMSDTTWNAGLAFEF